MSKKPVTQGARGSKIAGNDKTDERKKELAKRKRSRQNQISPVTWAILGTVAVIFLIVGFVIFKSATTNPATSSSAAGVNPTGHAVAQGDSAPDFTLPSVDGQTMSLSQFRGKVVLLELFAPWCPHCQNFSATLNQIQATYGSQGVQVLSVSASQFGRNYDTSGGTDKSPITNDDLVWFKSTYHITYPELFDKDVSVGNTYGLQSYPTVYVINAAGKVTYTSTGEIPYQTLEQQIVQAKG